ncbi:MAG: synthase subunit a [Verrucomicrobiota bacterium]
MVFAPFLIASAELAAETPEFLHKSFLTWYTNSILVTAIVLGVIIWIVRSCTRKVEVIPGFGQNFLEAVVEGFYGAVEGILGDKMAKKAFGLLGTLFIFILISNWFGLLPGVGSIGWHEGDPQHLGITGLVPPPGAEVHHEPDKFIPLLRPGTADMNMTIAMALVSMVLWFYWTMQVTGPTAFLKELFGVKGGMTGPILFLLVPLFLFVGVLEVVSILVRPVSLSLRLYGNIFAGENMLATMINIGHLFNCPQWLTSVLSCIVPIPFYFLELLIGFLQAMVFTLLVLVYLQLSTSHEEH